MTVLTRGPRRADRQEEIVFALRERIVAGRLAPGSQLPTRAEIEQDFNASPVTVQRALEHLKRDGFVEVNGRRGTYVAENPPHLTRYALVFAAMPSSGVRWPRFWSTLSHEAPGIEKELDRHLTLYYDINEEQNSRDYHQLVQEVRSHRVAGLIFPWNPSPIGPTPLLDEPDIPRVVLAQCWQKVSVPAVCLDNRSFFDKSLAYLRGQGRRRVAFMNIAGFDTAETREMAQEAAAAHGVKTEPYWWQIADPASPTSAHNIARLLFQGPADLRPDALVITDDNVAEGATAGLAIAGLAGAVGVVTHANFPMPPTTAVPSRRLGYDAREVLRAFIHCIDRQRQGEKIDTPAVIPAVFEDEL